MLVRAGRRARVERPAEEEVDELGKVRAHRRRRLGSRERREQRQQRREERRLVELPEHRLHAAEELGQKGQHGGRRALAVQLLHALVQRREQQRPRARQQLAARQPLRPAGARVRRVEEPAGERVELGL